MSRGLGNAVEVGILVVLAIGAAQLRFHDQDLKAILPFTPTP